MVSLHCRIREAFVLESGVGNIMKSCMSLHSYSSTAYLSGAHIRAEGIVRVDWENDCSQIFHTIPVEVIAFK